METTLRFAGDWSAYAGTAVALGLAALMWFLYYRESRSRLDAGSWILPTLRSLAVFFVAWILVGPVLHHEKVIRQLGRLFVFVDSSQSMNLVDKEMPVRRKIAALRAMNLLPKDDFLDAAEAVASQLDENQQLNSSLLAALNEDQLSQFPADARKYLTDTNDALRLYETLLNRIESANGSSAAPENVQQQVARRQAYESIQRQFHSAIGVCERMLDRPKNREKQWKAELSQFARLSAQQDQAVAAAIDEYVQRGQNEAFQSSIEQFDKMTRWERAQRLLLDPKVGALRAVSKNHDVEFFALRDGEAQALWWQRRGGKKSSGELPERLTIAANGLRTDLGESLSSVLGNEMDGAGLLVLTDGRHNALGSSPVSASRLLGENEVPVFSVGVGSVRPSEDMAIREIDGPRSVYADDVMRGDVLIRDQMKPGSEYRVRIQYGEENEERTVWEDTIQSTQSGERRLPFEFSVKEVFTSMTDEAERKGNALRNAPLEFDVSIEAVDASVQANEKLLENNRRALVVQAVTQHRKILILDGRQRWETRYLRNMFERLPQWQVDAFIDGLAADPQKGNDRSADRWRGSRSTPFPSSKEDLFQYELIVFGDVPSRLLNEDELGWINAFVGQRGGGLIFIDGRRGHLATYGRNGDPIGDLLPVEFDGDHRQALISETPASKLTLTADGERLNALRLVSNDGENQASWRELPSPRWIAPANALPGSVVYLQSPDEQSRDRSVLVFRPFGAGRVLYLGAEELWRWRYTVGDRFHQKFWVQVANWIALPPYAVDGEFVSLGMDQSVYEPNSSVAFHVSVRDEDGRPITDTSKELSAALYRGGRLVGEVPLKDDGNESGIFRGTSDELTAGRYEVRVRSADQEYDATAELVIKDTANREHGELSLDRELLQTMALHSGGEYFDEEQLAALPAVLKKLDKKKVISSETTLWDSYWWFIPVVLLLTAEWILRKKAGLV